MIMKASYQILLWAAITLFGINSAVYAQAQGRKAQFTGTISGIIVDSINKAPIPYSTITILSANDSSIVGGATSKKEGEFTVENIPNGKFTVKISYLGYSRLFIDNIEITKENSQINIGRIALNPAEINTKEVEVTAEREMISYNQEKKIIDVSKMIESKTGNATDLLRNLPSVQVDMDGNVSLRGSQSFQLLIDGKPTMMSKTDLLRQIPADAIQTIEIITNPSAKYDPEGNSGIMNIVTKRNSFGGFNGIVNASASRYDRYYANTLLNFKNDKTTHSLSIDYNNNRYASSSTLSESVSSRMLTDSVFTNTYRIIKPEGVGLQYEFKYDFDKEKSLTFNTNYSPSKFLRDMGHNYHTMNDTANYYTSTKTMYDMKSNNFHAYLDYSDINPTTMDGISANVLYAYWGGNTDDNVSEDFTDANFLRLPNSNYLEKHNTSDVYLHYGKAKFDYTKSFENQSKIELGANSEYYFINNDSKYNVFDSETKVWTLNTNYTNQMDFDYFINSAYATYSDNLSIFNYKLGVRAESFNRELKQLTSNKSNKNDFFSIFPTVHIGTQFDDYKSAALSYSRRITRPDPQQLNPFPDFEDNNIISIGNPDLKPSYSDLFELQYNDVYMFNFLYFSANVFYANSKDVINRTFREMPNGKDVISPVNNGSSKSLGSELTFSFAPFKWWKLNLVGTYSYSEVESESGVFAKRTFNSYNWRIFSNFVLSNTTFMSVNAVYNGKGIQPDGETEPVFYLSGGIRQTLFDNKLTLSLNVQDVFGYTYKYKNFLPGKVLTGDVFPKSQVISLGISYKINDYKPTQKKSDDTRIDFNGAGGGM